MRFLEVPFSYSHAAGNRLTAVTRNDAPHATFTFDANGNVLTKTVDGVTMRFTWDSENRLTGVTKEDGTEIHYAYDPFGRRIEKRVGEQVTRYLYDREDIVAEYDGANALQAAYIHGPGMDFPLEMKRGGNSYYYRRDGLGSITSLVDGAGNVVKSHRYDSFGNTLEESGDLPNPYTFTGREHDSETGLLYYRARYYDPQTGRFLSEDPIGFAGGDINFYAYVGNDPVNFVDPDGEHPVLVVLGMAAAGYFSAAVLTPDVANAPAPMGTLEAGPSSLDVALSSIALPAGRGAVQGMCWLGKRTRILPNALGIEIRISKDLRIGWHRIDFKKGRLKGKRRYLPHYHKRPGIKRHRPWE